MMVQASANDKDFFVLTMAQHNDFSRQLAEAFGNDRFEPLNPRDELIYVVANHDRGWEDYDKHPGLDKNTGLPYSLAQTPASVSLKTNYCSPDINQDRHAYCGLLSSMHSWGLHNKRYGCSQFIVKSRSTTSIQLPAEFEEQKQAVLARELKRQDDLKASLRTDQDTAPWVEDDHLFQNYKQLQFFDTLSLYFHLEHDAARPVETFIHVPVSIRDDANVTVRRVRENVYALTPFPFLESGIVMRCAGRYMQPVAPTTSEETMQEIFHSLPVEWQEYTFIAE